MDYQKNKKILIAGGNGFIGSNFSHLASNNGYEVIVAGKARNSYNDGLKFHVLSAFFGERIIFSYTAKRRSIVMYCISTPYTCA